MDNLTKIIAEALGLGSDSINDNASIYATPEWDSLTHMNIISDIESSFCIELTGDEIAEMQSYAAIKALLKSKGLI